LGWDSSEENKGIRLMKYFLLFLSVIYLKTSTFAQDQDQSPAKKVQYTPLPMIGSAPETGLQYGANLTTKFDLGSSQKVKPSFISLTLLNTTKNQFLAISKQEIFTDRSKFIGLIDYKKFPENFYGIGPTSTINDSTMISWAKFETELRGMRKLNQTSFIGAQIIFSSLDTVDILGDKKEYASTPGFEGGSFSGVGLSFNYDTRDDPYTAKKGSFIDAKYNFLIGDFSHRFLEIDIRKFIGLNGNTIALQNKFYNSSGNVPFWAMPKLLNQTGNSFMFRGLPDGRYRDKGAFAFQGEYRHSFKNRFGFVIFASTGSVFSSWSDIEFSEFKNAYGFGLRYQLRKGSSENLRLDIGFSPNEPMGIYILFKEAF